MILERHRKIYAATNTYTCECNIRSIKYCCVSVSCSGKTQMYAFTAWAPTGMGKRGHLTLWKYCKVYLCFSSYSITLSRRITYALFLQPVVSFWMQSPQICGASIPEPRWVTFVSRPLICPPWKNPLGAYDSLLF